MATGPDSAPAAPGDASDHGEGNSMGADNDLDPAAFLKAVRELSDKRDREDAERVRKLEEEIAKGREERARRRAEHARSISPEKSDLPARARDIRLRSEIPFAVGLADGPRLSSPPPLLKASPSDARASAAAPPVTHTPSTTTKPPSADAPMADHTATAPDDVPEFKGFGSIKRSSAASPATESGGTANTNTTVAPRPSNSTPTADPVSERKSAATATPVHDSTGPSASSLARSGTLSWQRRPNARSFESRPQSVTSIEASTATSQAISPEPSEPNREQIAAALGARDPTWFRQTPDRGAGSAAYRKSKDEILSGERSMKGIAIDTTRRGLPGMSRESIAEPDSQTSTQVSDTFSRGGSLRESITSATSRNSTLSAASNKPDLKSLIAADENQQRASPFDRNSSSLNETVSGPDTIPSLSSSVRTERAAFPTRSAGDFVQSAMMRRSDSVSKRWSAQPSGAVPRSNTAPILNASGDEKSHSSQTLQKHESTPDDCNPRPSEMTPRESAYDTKRFSRSTTLPSLDNKAETPRAAASHHGRSRSIVSNHNAAEDGGTYHSPSSPSKRWSPTKSSWIESSLTRPESPTKQPPPFKNTQPSWMVDLAKAKAQRASADIVPAGSIPPTAGDVSRTRTPSPAKSAPFGPGLLKRPETGTTGSASAFSDAPVSKSKPNHLAEKMLSSKDVASPPQNFSEVVNPLKLSSDDAATQDIVEQQPVIPESRGMDPKKEPSLDSSQQQPEPAQAKPPETKSITSFSMPRPKPETSVQQVTDFRSNLRTAAPTNTKPQQEPEFLSKFGNLRRTQQEKFVAPDVLKQNIERGKSGLVATGGPVKSERKDEFRDSLVSRKGEMKSAKEEGRDLPGEAHERKVSGTRQPPPKPEALARRDTLSKTKPASVSEQPRSDVPEALTRRKSLKKKPEPTPEPTAEPAKLSVAPGLQSLSKQVTAPGAMETKSTSVETSKLAARFNPNLASLIARGSPSGPPSRTESPSGLERSNSTPVDATQASESGPLHDMRKDRAKGPKKRKAGAAPRADDNVAQGIAATSQASDFPPTKSTQDGAASDIDRVESVPNTTAGDSATPGSSATLKKRPTAPGSAASIMNASLEKPALRNVQALNFSKPLASATSPAATKPENRSEPSKPQTPVKSPSLTTNSNANLVETTGKGIEDQSPVPEFRGFGSAKVNASLGGEQKEKTKTTTSLWERKPSSHRVGFNPSASPSLASRDSMDSIGSPNAGSDVGLAIGKIRGSAPTSAVPPKPTKSSRVVSGQLAGTSSSSGPTTSSRGSSREQHPETEAGHLLFKYFGSVPRSQDTLRIDTQNLLSNHVDLHRKQRPAKTIRKTVQIVFPDGIAKPLPPQEEYTFFEKSTYICTYTSIVDDDAQAQGNLRSQPDSILNKGTSNNATTGHIQTSKVFLWAGEVIHSHIAEPIHACARRAAKSLPNCHSPPQLIRQGQEPAEFLHALGGIFITRRKSRLTSSKQYMLCGRKHLGAIVFDEVEFSPSSLCAGFVYLVSCPVSLKEIKMFIWKGSECSTDELSAARLAATDVSETGDVTEIEAGMETSGFLRIFGNNTTKASIDAGPEFWTYKSLSENKFTTRLFRIMYPPDSPRSPSSLFSAIWGRRPSWNTAASHQVSSSAPSPISSPTTPSPTSPITPTPAPKQPLITQISPFSQSNLDPEGIYILDGYSEIYILLGPLFPSLAYTGTTLSPPSPRLSTPSNISASSLARTRESLFCQALLFAADYAILSASMEDRLCIPKSWVLFSGVPPRYIRYLFRGWDDNRRFWGTASLMAGSGIATPGAGPGAIRNSSPRLAPLGTLREHETVVLDEVLKEVFRC